MENYVKSIKTPKKLFKLKTINYSELENIFKSLTNSNSMSEDNISKKNAQHNRGDC